MKQIAEQTSITHHWFYNMLHLHLHPDSSTVSCSAANIACFISYIGCLSLKTNLIKNIFESPLSEGGALDILDRPELSRQPLSHLQTQGLLFVLGWKQGLWNFWKHEFLIKLFDTDLIFLRLLRHHEDRFGFPREGKESSGNDGWSQEPTSL